MAGYSRIILVGNLTRDPDYKQLESRQAVCRLGLAINRQFKNRQTGAMMQDVCFIDVDVWGPQAESCRSYLQKGRSVLVEGRLKLDTWEDQNGQSRSKHSIVADRVVFLGSGAGGEAEGLEADSYDVKKEPQSALEKDLLKQIDQIKGRAVDAAKRVKPAEPQRATSSFANTSGQHTASGEMDFKDVPAFEDDLPF